MSTTQRVFARQMAFTPRELEGSELDAVTGGDDPITVGSDGTSTYTHTNPFGPGGKWDENDI